MMGPLPGRPPGGRGSDAIAVSDAVAVTDATQPSRNCKGAAIAGIAALFLIQLASLMPGFAQGLASFPHTVTGSDGSSVILHRSPERMIVFDSGGIEILFAIGEADRVVGTHEFASFPPQANQIQRVGNSYAIDFEKVVSLKPDLVFLFFDRFVPELRRLGVPVLYLEPPRTLAGVPERIRTWGRIVDRAQAAENVAREFEAELRGIEQTLAGIRRGPRIFHDAAPGLWTLGTDSLASDIYRLLKAENVFADLSSAHQVSPEALVARNPEVIISAHLSGPEFFKTHPAFQALRAVKQSRVFVVDAGLISVSGPRLIQGVRQIAQALYPHLFPRAETD